MRLRQSFIAIMKRLVLDPNPFFCKFNEKGLFVKPSNHKSSLFGEKIVSASAMAAFEKTIIEKDQSLGEIFMDAAALGMLSQLESKVLSKMSFEKVLLLVGTGNNGGDAFVLGSLLLKLGYSVVAYQISDKLSALSDLKAHLFEKDGGERFVLDTADHFDATGHDLIIDGLLGTGFNGKLSGLILQLIKKVNEADTFVFSIDIPSGVEGDTGLVSTEAINADMTAYLGALKMGHLFDEGYRHSGDLCYVDFGMSVDQLPAKMALSNFGALYTNLPKHEKKEHKYSVGKVLVIAGSKSMPGAASLACFAAYRSGAGLVKNFTLNPSQNHHLEVISALVNVDEIKEDLNNSRALLIGPGLGKSDEAKDVCSFVSKLSDIATVIDADALSLMNRFPIDAILTPHRGELLKLLNLDKSSSEMILLEEAKKFARKHKVIIVYKGVPTVIISSEETDLCILAGNPGMATAGSGDVLSGIITSFLAQGVEPLEAAGLAVMAHGRAGDFASQKFSMRSMVASDIIDSLHEVL
jgi:ADP-dependent NAD(P)H-hydrate dehydratase / NAD(P)H-hydrate epimerase